MKRTLILSLLAALLLSASAFATNGPRKASGLFFPHYYADGGTGSVICVTNTNTNEGYCPTTDYKRGDIVAHYIYIDGADWREFDRYEFLTPGDTLCVIADQHNPEMGEGFLIVVAVDPSTWEPVVFEHLIGTSIMADADLNVMWQYTPYGIHAQDSETECTLTETDNDGDGAIDFDDSEYSYLPEAVMIPSFFEERGNFGNRLTLVTTTGARYDAEIRWLFYNNIEDVFSRTQRIRCWWTGALSEISQIVTDLGGDEEELGRAPVETGWAIATGGRVLDGSGNPVNNLTAPLLGVFSQFITGTDFSAGDALYIEGETDGFEVPEGDLDHVGP